MICIYNELLLLILTHRHVQYERYGSIFTYICFRMYFPQVAELFLNSDGMC